ncbi:MAG: c-type cytochrome domain-containing protein, partial [Planctomycetota bacterium]|nr:c-type cytochrome domain-containing protein [Planctomycetota bacterium]
MNKNSPQFPLKAWLRRTGSTPNSLSVCCVLICLLAFQRSSGCSASDMGVPRRPDAQNTRGTKKESESIKATQSTSQKTQTTTQSENAKSVKTVATTEQADPKPSSQKPIESAKLNFFESRIRPVLSEQCYSCHHSHGTAESDVILDHRKAIRAGNLIDPGNPSASRLLAIIQHKEAGLEMPQDGPKLADSVIKDFEQWIQDGAEDPREQPPSAEELTEATSWSSTLERRKGWWSFRAIMAPSPPQTSSHLSQHPVDRFVD